MNETLWIITSRSAPATSTPRLNAARNAMSAPNRTNAKKIAASVNSVLNFAAPEVAPDERQELHAAASSTSTPFVEMQRALGARGRVRVVRHHDDRLAVIAVERLQQVEDLVARLAVEVAGGLVAQQQRRIGHDGARDADALFLAARQLARVVVGAVRETDDGERHLNALPPIGLRQFGEEQRQLDVAGRGEHRQQVVELKHEADVARPPRRELAARHLVDAVAGDGDGSFARRVETADQIQQRRLARPGWPHQRQEVSRRNVEVDTLENIDAFPAAVIDLV